MGSEFIHTAAVGLMDSVLSWVTDGSKVSGNYRGMYRGLGGTFQEYTVTLVQGSHDLLLMDKILHDRKYTTALSSEKFGHAHS